MLGKNSGQIDIFNVMIFSELIPKDHLLLKIASIIDFSFVYNIVKDYYSDKGRSSYDPVILFKICLLEYLYRLSDVQVVKRIQTDVAFRWFLHLNLYDKVPDDTTISHFRCNRLKDKPIQEFFDEIVRKCIEKDLIKKTRFIVDSSDVAANVNYPSDKKLVCDSLRKVIREVQKFDNDLAQETLTKFEKTIAAEYEKTEKVSLAVYCKIAKEYAEYLYLKTYDELQSNNRYLETYGVLWDIIHQYLNHSKDKIVSCVDPDARIAHKSRGDIKRGYKDHIIVDEDSEIILASIQTPFNVGDEKELIPLIEKVKENFNLNPEEITADKVYSTNDNRAYLKDQGITTNIGFYEAPDREYQKFDLSQFSVADDLKIMKCPNNIVTTDFVISNNKKVQKNDITFKFPKKACQECPLKEQCLSKVEKKRNSGRRVKIALRYDAIIRDRKHNETEEFQIAIRKRFRVERRFATLVANHGLRRCRYRGLTGAKIHIIMANIACNLIRMVYLLCDKKKPSFAAA